MRHLHIFSCGHQVWPWNQREKRLREQGRQLLSAGRIGMLANRGWPRNKEWSGALGTLSRSDSRSVARDVGDDSQRAIQWRATTRWEASRLRQRGPPFAKNAKGRPPQIFDRYRPSIREILSSGMAAARLLKRGHPPAIHALTFGPPASRWSWGTYPILTILCSLFLQNVHHVIISAKFSNLKRSLAILVSYAWIATKLQ